jgi:hypothetical protein
VAVNVSRARKTKMKENSTLSLKIDKDFGECEKTNSEKIQFYDVLLALN